MPKEFNPTRSELKQLLRAFSKGLKALQPEDLVPRTPCPDSWTIASYVTGQLDQETQRTINAHIAFCDSCFDEYVALAGPEKISEILFKEESTLKQDPAKPDFWQELLNEGVSSFISPREALGGGTILAMFPFILQKLGVDSKFREVSAGENTYRVVLSITSNGTVECSIGGIQTPSKIPLNVLVSSATGGKDFFSTKTDASGNGHLVVSTTPDDVLLVFIFSFKEIEKRFVLHAHEYKMIKFLEFTARLLPSRVRPAVEEK